MIYTVITIIENNVRMLRTFKRFTDAKECLLREIDKMRERFNIEDESAYNDSELEDLDEAMTCTLFFDNYNASIVLDETTVR